VTIGPLAQATSVAARTIRYYEEAGILPTPRRTLPTALLGDRVPQHLQDIAVGWLRTITHAGHVLGALVMGTLADAARE